MIIKTILTWETLISKKENITLNGYYDSESPWDEIKTFFLEKKEILRLIKYLKNDKDAMRSIQFDGILVSSYENRQYTIFNKEKIVYDEKRIEVWKFQFPGKWFDWEIEHDDRLFSWSHIQEAVSVGLAEGYAAGLRGSKLIHNLTPVEFAIKYARDQPGD